MKKLLSTCQKARLVQAMFLCFSLLLSFSVVTGCGGGSDSSNGPVISGKESASAKRSILAEKVTGSVMSYTEKEEYTVIPGEKLESNRFLNVTGSSDITMLLDSDKHVYAGEGTKLHLLADGKKGSTATRIYLLEGLLVCGIDEKLGSKESFEVSTPNAALSVRGTTFTTKVEKNYNGSLSTNLTVSEGKVEVTTIEDGEQKTFMVEAGNSQEFTGDSPEEPELPIYLVGYNVVDLDSFSEDARFEYYGQTDGVETKDMLDNGYPSVYRLLKGRIYDTEDYLAYDIEKCRDRGYDGGFSGTVIAFSNTVTMQDGMVLDYCSAGIGGNLSYEDIPYGQEVELYGFFAPMISAPLVDENGNCWLDAELFGEETWDFCVVDYRHPGKSGSSVKESSVPTSSDKNDSEKGSSDSEPAIPGPTGDGGSETGTTYEYQVVGGTRSDGESFTAEDLETIFMHPFMYITYREERTDVEPPTWNGGSDIIGCAIERMEKNFTSGEVMASHYNAQGEMSDFHDLYITINGSSATIYDENVEETFYLTLIDTFTFEE